MTPDIVSIATEYGLHLKKAGQLYKTSCPFHKESAASLFFYPHSNTFNCFGCNANGDVVQFVKMWNNISYREALQLLGMEADIFNISSLRKRLEGDVQDNSQQELLNFYLLANKILHQKKLSLSGEGKILDKIYFENNLPAIKKFIDEISQK